MEEAKEEQLDESNVSLSNENTMDEDTNGSETDQEEAINADNSQIHSTVEQLDEETIQKLKGDAIGDTLYSEKFVLTTLMNLLKNEWNTQFEDDLCSLWDMTLEPAVKSYLFDKDFPKIAIDAINMTEQPRLAEILIGILGNICSAPKNSLTENCEQIKDVVKLIYCNDVPTLVQVVRFMKVIAYERSLVDFVDKDIIDRMLTFDTGDINTITCQTFNEFTSDQKLPVQIVSSAILQFVHNSCVNHLELDEFEKIHISDWNSQQRSRFVNFVNVFSNYCGYLNNINNNALFNECLPCFEEFFKYVYDTILKDMSDINNCLFPITSEIEFLIETITYMCRIINFTNIVENYLLPFMKMFRLCLKTDKDHADLFAELLCWFISFYDGPLENIRTIFLGEFRKEKTLSLLKDIAKRAPHFPDIDCVSKIDRLGHLIHYYSTDVVHSRG